MKKIVASILVIASTGVAVAAWTPCEWPVLRTYDAATFAAAYPFGQVTLTDKALPVGVRVKAFNPFSEPEVGHHYARSMASWGTYLAWSGSAWGVCTIAGGKAEIRCLEGGLPIRKILVNGRGKKFSQMQKFREHDK